MDLVTNVLTTITILQYSSNTVYFNNQAAATIEFISKTYHTINIKKTLNSQILLFHITVLLPTTNYIIKDYNHQ